jgi:hypothetical protein
LPAAQCRARTAIGWHACQVASDFGFARDPAPFIIIADRNSTLTKNSKQIQKCLPHRNIAGYMILKACAA